MLRPLGTRDPWHPAREVSQPEPETTADLKVAADPVRDGVEVGSPVYKATQRLAAALDARAETISQPGDAEGETSSQATQESEGEADTKVRGRRPSSQATRDATAELVARYEARKQSRMTSSHDAREREREGEAER